jgi:hypothetical protein
MSLSIEAPTFVFQCRLLGVRMCHLASEGSAFQGPTMREYADGSMSPAMLHLFRLPLRWRVSRLSSALRGGEASMVL